MYNEILRLYQKQKKSYYSIGLRYEDDNTEERYFCTPKDACIFASMGMSGIHYCTVPSFGDIVFAVVPEPLSEHYVIPVANNIKVFFQLIIACRGTQLLDQIPNWTKEEFEKHYKKMIMLQDLERETELEELKNAYGIETEDIQPYEIITNLNKDFPFDKIKYTSEYYDVLGIDIE